MGWVHPHGDEIRHLRAVSFIDVSTGKSDPGSVLLRHEQDAAFTGRAVSHAGFPITRGPCLGLGQGRGKGSGTVGQRAQTDCAELLSFCWSNPSDIYRHGQTRCTIPGYRWPGRPDESATTATPTLSGSRRT